MNEKDKGWNHVWIETDMTLKQFGKWIQLAKNYFGERNERVLIKYEWNPESKEKSRATLQCYLRNPIDDDLKNKLGKKITEELDWLVLEEIEIDMDLLILKVDSSSWYLEDLNKIRREIDDILIYYRNSVEEMMVELPK